MITVSSTRNKLKIRIMEIVFIFIAGSFFVFYCIFFIFLYFAQFCPPIEHLHVQ